MIGELLFYNVRNVFLGSAILGVIGGIIGSFAVLRRQSLLGDALAHAALPGVCLAFMLTGAKSPWPIFVGALFAGLAGAFIIQTVIRWSRIKEDASIGIVLSVFFGFGIVLLTHIQKMPGGNQAGLDKYLFGQAAALMTDDIQFMIVLGVVVITLVSLFFKELKLVTFNREFAASIGLPVRFFDAVLTLLLVTVVVVGLRLVGVVLMVAALITPPAAARQWTDRFGVMVILAGIFGGISGVTGAVISASVARVPTGPAIVLVASAILVVSVLAAPNRGILWAWARERRMARRMKEENLLKDIYMIGERVGRFGDPVSGTILMGTRGQSGFDLARHVRPLARTGLITSSGEDYRLTERGIAEAAKIVRKHRVWEVYLARRLELASDHLHRDADDMEHALTDAFIDQLDQLMEYPEHDPHGRLIPRTAE